MAENRMVKLKSFDERIFDVDEAVASEWMAVKNMMEDTGMNAPVQLSNVSSEILEVVIKYCEYHVAFRNRTSEDKSTIKAEEAQKWDAEFIQKVDQQTLFELILAANYLNIQNLLDLGCQTVADNLKGKTPEEVRKIFNIENDFTPEEEAERRKQNQWAFDLPGF